MHVNSLALFATIDVLENERGIIPSGILDVSSCDDICGGYDTIVRGETSLYFTNTTKAHDWSANHKFTPVYTL